MTDAAIQPTIRCKPGDIAPYVLLPGDPERARWISTFFDDAREVGRNREYWTYTGNVQGVPISVMSTGIGCPGAAMGIEELIKLGAHTLIRVGTCGYLQEDVHPGDLVIATGAVRDDGLSKELVPPQYPAVSDLDVTLALRKAAQASGHPFHVGLYRTGDAFYGLDSEATFGVWKRAGVKIFEQEAAALFTIASLRGVRAGAIVAVDGPAGSAHAISYKIIDRSLFQKAVEMEIRIAIQAIVALAKGIND